jgi:hypothetical protein
MSRNPGVMAGAAIEFRKMKQLAEAAMGQMDDAAFFPTPGPETNPAALIVKHMAGNLRSRWTLFLTTDGEKPDRDRDTEFELSDGDTRQSLMGRWEDGWSRLFEALGPLGDADLERVVTIRSEPHTVLTATLRQLTHYSYHIGQIVLLARHYRGGEWRTLSVPRGGSREFNARMMRK